MNTFDSVRNLIVFPTVLVLLLSVCANDEVRFSDATECSAHKMESLATTAESKSAEVVEQKDAASSQADRIAISIEVASRQVASREDSAVDLRCEIRSLGDSTNFIIKPFGDWYAAQAGGIKILDSDGNQIRYSGPIPSYQVGEMAFLWLGSGESFIDSIKLDNTNFDGIEELDQFEIEFSYHYDGQWNEEANGLSPWEGKLKSKRIKFKRK